jgi:serine/threonine protein kinase
MDVAPQFPFVLVREIRALRALRHPNIIALVDVVTAAPSPANRHLGDVFMVFELAKHDLAGLIGSGFPLTPAHVKSFMQQLLRGLAHMHAAGWTHRDLKTANLLVTEEGVLKVADLGLAKNMHTGRRDMTTEVVTLWYRSPELLLGDTTASYPLDMWSVGCIFGELLKGRPVFSGEFELEQMAQIYSLCGAVDLEAWPQARTLRSWAALKPQKRYVSQLRGQAWVKR